MSFELKTMLNRKIWLCSGGLNKLLTFQVVCIKSCLGLKKNCTFMKTPIFTVDPLKKNRIAKPLRPLTSSPLKLPTYVPCVLPLTASDYTPIWCIALHNFLNSQPNFFVLFCHAWSHAQSCFCKFTCLRSFPKTLFLALLRDDTTVLYKSLVWFRHSGSFGSLGSAVSVSQQKQPLSELLCKYLYTSKNKREGVLNRGHKFG